MFSFNLTVKKKTWRLISAAPLQVEQNQETWSESGRNHTGVSSFTSTVASCRNSSRIQIQLKHFAPVLKARPWTSRQNKSKKKCCGVISHLSMGHVWDKFGRSSYFLDETLFIQKITSYVADPKTHEHITITNVCVYIYSKFVYLNIFGIFLANSSLLPILLKIFAVYDWKHYVLHK